MHLELQECSCDYDVYVHTHPCTIQGGTIQTLCLEGFWVAGERDKRKAAGSASRLRCCDGNGQQPRVSSILQWILSSRLCQRKCAYPVLDDPHAGRNQAFFFKHRLHLLVSGLVGQVADINGAVRGRRRMREIGLELCLASEFANKNIN